jgi:hypothetical protein
LGGNWILRNGGLPSFLKRVAKHIKEKGHSEQNAYQMAVGVFRVARVLKEAWDLVSRLTESSPAWTLAGNCRTYNSDGELRLL